MTKNYNRDDVVYINDVTEGNTNHAKSHMILAHVTNINADILANILDRLDILEKQNKYTEEDVTSDDDILFRIRKEIEDTAEKFNMRPEINYDTAYSDGLYGALSIIDKYLESQGKIKEIERMNGR